MVFTPRFRQGKGPWRGLEGICLTDSPLIVVCNPAMAKRLMGCDPAALAHEPLLGDDDRWERWFAQAGHPCRVNPVAVFNDMGMMVQAAEQGLGVALSRQLVAADALRDGRLVRLSPLVLSEEGGGFLAAASHGAQGLAALGGVAGLAAGGTAYLGQTVVVCIFCAAAGPGPNSQTASHPKLARSHGRGVRAGRFRSWSWCAGRRPRTRYIAAP